MMKKVWPVLLAVVLVFGLALVGCGSKSSGSTEPPIDNDEFTSNLTGFTTELIKNQYADDKDSSRGLQSKFAPKGLLNGYKIKAGDTFTLQLKFQIDKPLNYDLEIGFVDTTVGASEGYWRTLTWDKDDPADGMYKVDKAKLATANVDIELDDIELTVVNPKGASSAAAAANTLVFECRDLWSKEPVKITFVSFLLIVNGGGDEPPPPPPPPPTDPTFTVKVGTAEVDAIPSALGGDVEIVEGGYKFSTDAVNYQGTYSSFKVDLGTSTTLLDIASISFKAEAFTDNGKTNKSLLLWARTAPFSASYWSGAPEIQKAAAVYNTGAQDLTIEIDPVKVLGLDIEEANVIYLAIYWPVGGNNAASYQFTDVTLTKTTTPFTPIKINNTLSLREPVDGETPATSVTGTGYTGTVTWVETTGSVPVTGNFEAGKGYTAAIVLTKKNGYTFDGIAANSFVVGDASVTSPAGTASAATLTVTAVYAAAAAAIPEKEVTFTAGDTTTGFATNGTSGIISDVTATSYTFEQTAGYGPWGAFKVTFDTGVVLSDYTKLDFTWAPTATGSGDTGSKKARVFVYATPPSGNITDGGANAANKIFESSNWATGETCHVDIGAIDPSINLNEVWVIINLWSGAAKFTVKDIKFFN